MSARTPSPDSTTPGHELAYLAPSQLRLGSIGVFAGDWSWYGTPPRIAVGYIGTLVDTWNGWMVFRCTREVAEAIVTEHEHLRDLERARLSAEGLTGDELENAVDEAASPLRFEGDELICDETARWGEPSIERMTPDEDGCYVVQGYNWCWIAVDPSDCDRIAGDIPAPGHQQEFVYLPHTDLRAPHDRLRVTEATTLPGDAVTAVLRLGRRRIGTIHATTSASAFHPSGQQFGHTHLAEFASQCRWYGQPVTEQQVLQHLLTEHRISQVVAQAATRQMTVVRVRDSDGPVLNTDWLADNFNLRAALSRDRVTQLTSVEAHNHPDVQTFIWEYWNGSRWRLIDAVTPSRQQPLAGGDE